jgi:poly(hydroxyalkanoate) granule-associated protein
MAEEVKQVVENAAEQASDTAAEAKKAVKKAAEKGEEVPVVAEAEQAVGGKSQQNPVSAKVAKAAKDVQEGIEKSPVTPKVKQTVKDTAETVQKSPLLDAVHKVLLAGIGAAALAQEEIEDFVNRLVERGEIAEADGKKVLKDVLEKRKQMVKLPAMPKMQSKKITSDLEKRIEDMMTKMNIPTKDEIDALSAKITALTKKVDELKKSG